MSPLRVAKASDCVSVALADEPGVEVLTVQVDVPKQPLIAVPWPVRSISSCTVLPSSAALVKALASAPNRCTGLVGFFVSGVSAPIKRTVGIVYHHILRSNPSERVVFSVAVEAVGRVENGSLTLTAFHPYHPSLCCGMVK